MHHLSGCRPACRSADPVLTGAELHDIKLRLRFVNDLLIAIRDDIHDESEVQLAMSIRKIEADVVMLAGSIKTGVL